MDSITGYINDTWRSTDKGATWTLVNANPEWTARGLSTSVAMPDGSIVLMGGHDNNGTENDVWRSTDNGATWTQVTASAGWSARVQHSSVALPDGSIVLMGGWDSNPSNDVWRFVPAGSSAQNPSHTYTIPGTYSVSLTASNAEGSDTEMKEEYIVVTPTLILKTFSTTEVFDDPGVNGLGSQTVYNLKNNLQLNGWTPKFIFNDTAVTRESLGVNGDTPEDNLNHATLHWHVGH